MKYACERCSKILSNLKDCAQLELSQKGYGTLDKIILCKECSDDYYKFLNSDYALVKKSTLRNLEIKNILKQGE